MKRELERIGIPDEHEARERTWPVVHAAFAVRQPVPQPSHWRWVAVVAVALAATLAATLSQPGRAVIDEIREVVGVDRAQPALFSLPTSGRLLVASDAGIWIVQEDGSKRLLGNYQQATWSPFGRFVAATLQNELAALELDGDVRWTLARPRVRYPRWMGTETDTRIAYVDRTGLRVVAGDGTRDRLLSRGGRGPLAWRPGEEFVLAFADQDGRVALVDADSERILWRTKPLGVVHDLEWSSDGRRLLARLGPSRENDVVIYTRGGLPFTRIRVPAGTVTATAARPGSHARAVAIREGDDSRLFVTDARGTLLAGPGVFQDLAWSPDGRWLLVGWPAADQWVFVRADGRGIRAVSNISEQFRSRSFPEVHGWVP